MFESVLHGIVEVSGRRGFAVRGNVGVGAGLEDFEFIEARFVLIPLDGGKGGEANEARLDRAEAFKIQEGIDGGAHDRVRKAWGPCLQKNGIGANNGLGFSPTQDDAAPVPQVVDARIEKSAPQRDAF